MSESIKDDDDETATELVIIYPYKIYKLPNFQAFITTIVPLETFKTLFSPIYLHPRTS